LYEIFLKSGAACPNFYESAISGSSYCFDRFLDERPGDVAINENRCFETTGQTNTHSSEDAATLHFKGAFFRVPAIPSSAL
jgi:hypothetical protein